MINFTLWIPTNLTATFYDTSQSGTLTLSELWVKYAENNWYNARYQTAIEKLIYEADTNRDHSIDMEEYIR